MGQQIVIHPVPRENIPYSINVETDGGRVISARCGAAAYWGLDGALAGMHPFDALQVTQRTQINAGVSHAIAAATGLEGLLQVDPPANGRLLRNILQGLEFIHAHITHFYQRVLPDFLNIASPAAGEKLPQASGQDLREHYWQSFEVLAGIHSTMAVFGGRVPYIMSVVPGGVAVSPDYQRVFELHSRWQPVLRFVRNVFVNDVATLFTVYQEYGGIGSGARRMLAMGAFPAGSSRQGFLPAGTSPGSATMPETSKITEDNSYTWFKGNSGTPGAPPEPEIKSQAYSWMPALKYEEQRYETGPLARMILSGEGKTAQLGAQAYSVMGRNLARAYESMMLAEKMEEWIGGLNPAKPAVTGKFSVPEEGEVWSVGESPAGSLVHFFRITDERIEFYRIFSAAAWNLSPRDGGGSAGPLEEALVGTPIANPQDPAEVLRVFRAFS